MIELVPIQRIDNGDGTVTWRTQPDPRVRMEHWKFRGVFFGGFEEVEPPPEIFKPSRCVVMLKDRPND